MKEKKWSRGRKKRVQEKRRKAAVKRAFRAVKSASDCSDAVKWYYVNMFTEAVHMDDPIYQRRKLLNKREA